MAKEAFLINPVRGKKRKSTTRSKKKATGRSRRRMSYNPIGEEVMIMGLNPRRGRRRTTKRKRKRRNSYMKNAWFGQSKRHATAAKKGHSKRKRKYSTKRKRRRNPIMKSNPVRRRKRYTKRRRYRRNPAGVRSLRLGGFNVTKMLPLFLTGGLSAIATTMAPNTLGMVTPATRYGSQAAVGLIGGIIINNAVGKEHGTVWFVTSGAVIVSDMLQKYVLPRVLPGGAMSAFPYEDTAVGAFPEYGADYGDEDDMDYDMVGDYPYSAQTDTLPY